MQHRWAEVWLAPFVPRPLPALSVFGVMPGGVGLAGTCGIGDTCAALWDGHGMAAEHRTWTGSFAWQSRVFRAAFPLGEHLSQQQGLAWPHSCLAATSSHPRETLLPTASNIQQIWEHI